jgi:hypothetical protein
MTEEAKTPVLDDDDTVPMGVTRLDNGKSIVKLNHPVEYGRVEYTELTVRQMYGADLMESDKARGDMGRGIMLISIISRVPIGAVKKFGEVDIARVLEEISFLGQA